MQHAKRYPQVRIQNDSEMFLSLHRTREHFGVGNRWGDNMFIPYKISEPTMLDHNKQRVGEGLPERKPGGNCIWQRPICPSWTLKVTVGFFGFGHAQLCLSTKPYTLTDSFSVLFKIILIKTSSNTFFFNKKHANISLEINFDSNNLLCRAVSIPS